MFSANEHSFVYNAYSQKYSQYSVHKSKLEKTVCEWAGRLKL